MASLLFRDGFAAAQGGITWSISPLLSLGADQEMKINEKAIQGPNQLIKAIHLDNYRKPEEQKGIAERLFKIGKDSSVTIIILSSPQAIRDSITFQNVYKHGAKSGSLKLLVIDEAHLFVQFGQVQQEWPVESSISAFP